MTIKAKSHRMTHFVAWVLLLIAVASWVTYFLIGGGHVAEYMWWPVFITGVSSSILFGMIFFKGLFD